MVSPPDPEIDAFLAGAERRAFRMAEIITRDREEALDIVQEAMLQLVRIKGFPAVETAVEDANKALQKALGTTTLKQLSLGSVE